MGSLCRLLVVAACVAAMVVAGASAAPPKPVAAFNAKVTAIGSQAQKALLALPPAPVPPTAADQAADAGQLQVIYRRVAQRLAALTPPKAIKPDFKILLASYQAAARNAGAWRAALLTGTAEQAAKAAHTLYLDPTHYRASLALVRMSRHGYYFGTFFR
jgi:hypothetical protein